MKICSKVFYLNKTLKSPVYVYYEIDNFYNNHREYVKSKSWGQLRAENPSVKLRKKRKKIFNFKKKLKK